MRWGDLRALRWAGASIVFQGALHSLNPVQRVGHQIAEPIRLHEPELSDADGRARGSASCSSRSGCPPARARAYPHQLSGGQRQRVMIAMALACRPAADRRRRADHRARRDGAGAGPATCCRAWSSELGVGLLIISHDLSVLADVCDRIAVMYAGRVVEQGPADQVFTDPLHPYAAALSASFPRIGDPAARYAPAGPAGRPARPARAAAGLLVRARGARWRSTPAATAEPPLRRGRARPRRPPASGWGSRDRDADGRAPLSLEARGAARRVRHPRRRRRHAPSTAST